MKIIFIALWIIAALVFGLVFAGFIGAYGTAIDVYVLDINGDLSYNQKDAKLFEIANLKVEKKNLGLRGFCKPYINTKPHHYFTRQMIHIDRRKS